MKNKTHNVTLKRISQDDAALDRGAGGYSGNNELHHPGETLPAGPGHRPPPEQAPAPRREKAKVAPGGSHRAGPTSRPSIPGGDSPVTWSRQCRCAGRHRRSWQSRGAPRQRPDTPASAGTRPAAQRGSGKGSGEPAPTSSAEPAAGGGAGCGPRPAGPPRPGLPPPAGPARTAPRGTPGVVVARHRGARREL